MSIPLFSTLEEFERMLQNGRKARDSFIEAAKSLLLQISYCQRKLRDLENEIGEFNQKCRTAKTSGTVCNATGAALNTVGFITMFIPFAQPVGVAFSVIGSCVGAVGAATQITTCVVDSVKTKTFMKEIGSSVSKLKEYTKKLEMLNHDYNKTLEILKNVSKLSDNEVSVMANNLFAVGKNLKKGAEQMGSIGIFMIALAMAQQGLADGGTLILMPIANEIVKIVPKFPQLYSAVPKMAEFTASMASSGSLLGQSTTNLGVKAVEEMLETGFGAVTIETIKSGTKVGAKAAVQGVFTTINIGMAIWDISSLIKGWNVAHPAVETIRNVVSQLAEVELQIQNQLKIMTTVNTQTKTRAEMDDDHESETSDSSDEEEDDRIRIYDKSTETMKNILRVFGIRGISSLENLRGQTASHLLRTIQGILRTTSTGDFGLSSYFLFVDCVQELISSHQSKLERVGDIPSTIKLCCYNETICFDGQFREYVRQFLLPIQSIMKIPLIEINQLCCIYRFRCIICENGFREFNYVGQSINFKARYKTHTGEMLKAWMNHEDRMALMAEGMDYIPSPYSRLPSSGLHDHGTHNHNHTRDSDVFEVDIVQRLTANASKSTTDKRVRRSWEIYNQWLYKAMLREGGGSRR